MGVYFTNIADGEPGEPATWNTRLQSIEDAILAMPTAGIVKIVGTTTIASDTPSLTVSNIPQTATNLLIHLALRTTAAGLGSSLMRMYFNGYTNAQPARRYQGSGGSTADDGHILLQGNGYDIARPSLANIRIFVPFYRKLAFRKGAIISSVAWFNTATAQARISTGFMESTGSFLDDEPISSFTIDDAAGILSIKAGSTYAVNGVL